MDEFEGLTDEEIARRLQEEFEKEVQLQDAQQQQHSQTGSGAQQNEDEDEDTRLARQLQEQFDQEMKSKTTDVEFAKSLQKEFDDEATKQPQPSSWVPTSIPPYKGSYLPPPPPLVSQPPYGFSAPIYTETSHKHRAKRQATASTGTIKRLRSDTLAISKLQNPTIFIHPDESDITFIEALIIGPEDTPYDGGFFHFDMQFPDNYPWSPPTVKLTTTDLGRCRFNPNLYADGKVCLSILGTWTGPAWSAVQTCLSTLQSIQTLMNPAPYHNEPGYEKERTPGDVASYNSCITHETIRVAVVGVLNDPAFANNHFKKTIEEEFMKRYDKYVKVCESNTSKEGQSMVDPFGEARGQYQYQSLLLQLNAIHSRLSSEQ